MCKRLGKMYDNMGAKMFGATLIEYEPEAKPKGIHYHQKRECIPCTGWMRNVDVERNEVPLET